MIPIKSPRKNIRLKDYDYSLSGCYFITICVSNHNNRLGNIVGAGSSRPESPQMVLSKYGTIASDWLTQIPIKYPNCTIDCQIIMPNHIHFILRFANDCGREDPMSLS